MIRTLSIMEARRQLAFMPETLTHNGNINVVEITRRGKSVLAVLPWELYEVITETFEVMADKELMVQLRQSIREIEAGTIASWEDAKRELTN